MKNEYAIEEQRRERDQKRFFWLWMRRVLIGYVLCMAVFFVYLFVGQGLNISYVGNIQKNYAKFLINQNDTFIDYMIEFEALTVDTEVEYSANRKAAIKENLEKQNAFLKKLQKLPPDQTNTDYLDLYQDMLQIFAFYIQGEVMKAEYCYSYDPNATLESQFTNSAASKENYTMGQELCNMMGNMILNNFKYINAIRDTAFKSKHNIQEMGGTEDNSNGSNNSNGSIHTHDFKYGICIICGGIDPNYVPEEDNTTDVPNEGENPPIEDDTTEETPPSVEDVPEDTPSETTPDEPVENESPDTKPEANE